VDLRNQPEFFVTREIIDRGEQQTWIVPKCTEPKIALVAEQTSCLLSGVVMVDVQAIGPAVCAGWRATADCAQAILFAFHALVSFFVNAVVPARLTQFVRAPLWGAHHSLVNLRVIREDIERFYKASRWFLLRTPRHVLKQAVVAEHFAAMRTWFQDPTTWPNSMFSRLWCGHQEQYVIAANLLSINRLQEVVLWP
jgi:hypothetical protein